MAKKDAEMVREMVEKEEKSEKPTKKAKVLEDLPGVGDVTAEKLRRAGYVDFEKIAAASPSLLKKASQSVPAAERMDALQAAGPGAGHLSPDAGLVFTDARSLSSSWVHSRPTPITSSRRSASPCLFAWLLDPTARRSSCGGRRRLSGDDKPIHK